MKVLTLAIAVLLLMSTHAKRGMAEATGTILSSIVRVEAIVPGNARTARILGKDRTGTGLIVDDAGLVLTIGYLILEAGEARVTDSRGKTVPAKVVAYDYNTNFGLLRTLAAIDGTAIRFGDSDLARATDRFLAVSFGGSSRITPVFVASRHEFAGFWEFLLDDAIFTAPQHLTISGAGLIGEDGRLYGVGFGQVSDAAPDSRFLPGNMFVPINLLKPIFGDLVEQGRDSIPAHPWLGIYTREVNDQLLVFRVAPDSPGEAAGVRPGDEIVSVGGKFVSGMADFFRKMWAGGSAGDEVALTITTDGVSRDVTIQSTNRYDWLRLAPTY